MLWTLLLFVVARAELPGPVIEVGLHRNGLATSQTGRMPGDDFAMLRHREGCEFSVERYGPDLTERWSTPLAFEPRMALGQMVYAGLSLVLVLRWRAGTAFGLFFCFFF